MAKICDICGDTVGFRGFKCRDGILCSDCYQIVTANFSSTITQKTLKELKMEYVQSIYRSHRMRERE